MVSPPKPSLPQFLVNPPESSAMVFPEDFFCWKPEGSADFGWQISTTTGGGFFCGVPNQKIVPPKKMLKNLTSFHFGIFRIPCKKNNGGWLNLSICTNFVGW